MEHGSNRDPSSVQPFATEPLRVQFNNPGSAGVPPRLQKANDPRTRLIHGKLRLLPAGQHWHVGALSDSICEG